ncbi:hypothetical protein [Bradyrhizobium sp. CCBAU 11445]|uniref:hypothetical protein n=1 Tax=Bradyrhizobium sp. CCBAU 11445 TaxID=1630896 RepID=UPI0023054B2A|nr:hypothetical protein [Bradyrhizobium sp. CCBAU 11445]
MQLQKESPALAARGVPATDLLDGSITPENSKRLRFVQAHYLSQRFALAPDMAEALAPFVYGGER